MNFFTNTKDRTPLLSNSGFIYKFHCPGCSEQYVGKSNRTFHTRTLEHAWDQKESSIYIHLKTCTQYQHIIGLFSIGNDDVNLRELQINLVRDNTTIIDKTNDWKLLDFLEPFYIKEHNPSLNIGLKACKPLHLF